MPESAGDRHGVGMHGTNKHAAMIGVCLLENVLLDVLPTKLLVCNGLSMIWTCMHLSVP